MFPSNRSAPPRPNSDTSMDLPVRKKRKTHGNNMIMTAHTNQIATFSTSNAPQPHQPPPFLRLPAELRNKIYSFATSSPTPLVICPPMSIIQSLEPRNTEKAKLPPPPESAPIWTLPPLAEVNKQLRREVIPIFFESNTLQIYYLEKANFWYPFRSQLHMSNLTALFFDLNSSITYYLTLTSFKLQPTRIVRENFRYLHVVAENPRDGEDVLVKERNFDLLVRWVSFERCMLEALRLGVFLSRWRLEQALRDEVERRRELWRKVLRCPEGV